MRARSLHNLDLNLLTLFEAIYSEGGLTAAGKKLGMTQPAVSHALTRLREQVGDPLFQRVGRGVVPTPFAHSLVGDVRAALAILERQLGSERRFDPANSSRVFRLALREAAETMILPPLVALLGEAAPGVELVSVRAERRQMEELLVNGELDLAIDIAMPMGSRIRRRPMWSDPLVVLGRRDHPLLQGELSHQQYLQARHILVSSRSRGGGIEDYALSNRGEQRRIALRVASYASALTIMREQDLLLTASAAHVAAVASDLPLRAVPLPFDIAPVHTHLYWHSERSEEASLQWLLAQVLGVVLPIHE